MRNYTIYIILWDNLVFFLLFEKTRLTKMEADFYCLSTFFKTKVKANLRNVFQIFKQDLILNSIKRHYNP